MAAPSAGSAHISSERHVDRRPQAVVIARHEVPVGVERLARVLVAEEPRDAEPVEHATLVRDQSTGVVGADIDHMVPLADAHRSGGWAWSTTKKRAYANDLDHPETLIAVDDGSNSSKSDKSPDQWLPPNGSCHW